MNYETMLYRMYDRDLGKRVQEETRKGFKDYDKRRHA